VKIWVLALEAAGVWKFKFIIIPASVVLLELELGSTVPFSVLVLL
jgi:hypothetical protein